MNKRTVCAVIVTFNRKDLLFRCIERVCSQTTKPDRLIIVDNASNDGTINALRNSKWSNDPTFHFEELQTNTGGAGGFHRGMQLAMTSGCTDIWLMDDDGYPEKNCLEILIENASENYFIGPVVIDDCQHDMLCFPIRLPGSNKIIRNIGEIEALSTAGKLDGVVMPFNGILMPSSLAMKIGLPRKEYFIWGDDIEYTWRAQRSGAKISTIAAARFHHPRADQLGTPMLFGLLHYNDTNSDLKHYCLCRNNMANLVEYRGNLAALAFFIKTIWFYSFTRPNCKRISTSIIAMIHGWRKNFNYHSRFIGQ